MTIPQYEKEYMAQKHMRDAAKMIDDPVLFVAAGLTTAQEQMRRLPPEQRELLAKVIETAGKNMGK